MNAWLIDTLLMTSALMVLVLLIRQPVARAFGPSVAYALWLLPAARLLMPSLPGEQLPVTGGGAVSGVVRDAVLTGMNDGAGGTAASQVTTIASWPLVDIAAALWLGGAIFVFTVQMVRYVQARRGILNDAKELQSIGGVRVIASSKVEGPLAFGLISRFIAVPTDFAVRFTPTERELALAHELQHHMSRDLFANMMGFVALCLQWFNPLAWASWRAFRLDQEAACDARVLAGRSADDRQLYGHTLARAACGGVPAFATALNSPKTIIERLRRLTMKETSKRRALAGKIALGMVVTITVPMTATLQPAKAEPETQSTDKPVFEKRVIKVVKTGDGDNVRTVERNGTTYVFKSDKPLSDEEVEAKIAKVDAEMPVPPNPPSPPEAVAGQDGEKQVRHKVIVRRHGDGSSWTDKDGVTHDMSASAMVPEISVKEMEGKCEGSEPVTSEATSADGKRTRVTILSCRKDGGKFVRGETISGLKEARAEIAADPDIPEKTKAEILVQLDQNIAKLEAEQKQ